MPRSGKVFFIMKKKQRKRQTSLVISPRQPESRNRFVPFSAYYAALVLGKVEQEEGFGDLKKKKKSVVIYLRMYLLPEAFIFAT